MLVLNMLFIYIMEDLSIILCLFLVVILVSYCTYMFYRPVNVDNFENEENTENILNEKITDEQLEANNFIYNKMKNSNINFSNPCRLINDFCNQRIQQDYCNNDKYLNNLECTAGLKFCNDPIISKQCGAEDEIVNWMNSLSDEDKKKIFEAIMVLQPELKALTE